MKRNNLWLLFLFVLVSFFAVAQKKPAKKSPAQKSKVEKPFIKKPDAVADEKKVRDIVSFLEYMLNTLGSSSTPIRDKEVLITESYSKIFRDSKVQVEDDLDEERKVITNKDVVAYLKDVNFFFNNVRFEFTIEDIKSSTLPDGQHFYKVTTRRNLSGATADKKPVNNTQPRYIEINYNPKDQDLKIVSIYTKEFNEKEALTNWWRELSYEWQSIFKKKFNLNDSVRIKDIKRITSAETLDLSNNQYILSIEPLALFLNLKSLNISQTVVGSLTPIRNLTELVELNISKTKIKDLSPLRYSNKLKSLNISLTGVSDISVLEKMPSMQMLNVSETPVADFSSLASLTELQEMSLARTKILDLTPLKDLTQLIDLDISDTGILDVSPLKALTSLRILDIDSTRIRNIQPLSNLESLEILSANYSSIADLMPLQKLVGLQKIYCDKTLIKREAADAFMAANPKVLVIFDSEDLKIWWSTLSPAWQKIFNKATTIGSNPSKEELAKIQLLDSLNLSNTSISNLEPIRKLQKLSTITVSKTGVTDLSPLRSLKEIKYLDISETSVTDISILVHLTKLKTLRADNAKIENIELITIPSLEKFYADNTSIEDIIAREFLERNPACLLIYKTAKLNQWWSNLPQSWKSVFQDQLNIKSGTRENLHKLIEKESLSFEDAQITDLTALSEFVRLKELHFSGTAVTNITPIENIKYLKSLRATNSPIQNIESLSSLSDLEDLDISNTPIEDVYELWRLKKLKKLNCAGTQLKRLDALEKMENLEFLDCSNTNVSRLSPLDYLPLKTLKCYNTKVSTRAIENFKASHPECNVIYYR
jgi:Leucine-rich repeat (LRR) protein